ncbi:hypothetical protein MLD38_029335 [Melastoma candidum]|uniref:Uncharacterized protein n=1 Tax=Melastoma candidum TaxID=119954 RepID=A0ACB9N622_9MYRT|nr:hypothetical protein MLD38_029335 [Melastoma candidum]
MADEITINGVDRGSELEVDGYERESRVVELINEVKSLELENDELARCAVEVQERNDGFVAEIERLMDDEVDMMVTLEGMRVEIDSAEDEKRAIKSVMKRAVDLETEVVRLQHELISTTQEVEEMSRKAVELRGVVEEKEERIAGLAIKAKDMRSGKVDSEVKTRELESEVEVLLASESERVRVETELQGTIEEKEGFVSAYEKKIAAVEAEVRKGRVELEKAKKDKSLLEDAVKESEEKAKKLDQNMIELRRELKTAESIISGLKEKTGDAINGREVVADAADKKCLIGLKDHWHMVAIGSAGVIAVAALTAHVYFAKRQN